MQGKSHGTCRVTGKRMFTELEAKIALAGASIRKDSRRKKVEKHIYQCQACHSWHLTSQRRKTQPKKLPRR